jgi:hypothetical protein
MGLRVNHAWVVANRIRIQAQDRRAAANIVASNAGSSGSLVKNRKDLNVIVLVQQQFNS